ncbi:MAG: hypothetical protein FJ279_06680 [Planctomycetes bacterium]|nr:hypothetical protein [Planctomycetota bacterium]
MKHPPYHLRPNKAVDRFMLIEALRRLGRIEDLSHYTYYGFGGPYLEEFRLLYEFCPEVGMVSIEENEETYKRQKFHRPCGTVQLLHMDFQSFLAQYDFHDKKSILWLDYTGLKCAAFDDFKCLLSKVAANSLIKVTLRADPRDYFDKHNEFRIEFGEVMPNPSADPPRAPEVFAKLLQEMLQIAAQQALPSVIGRCFQPISSFVYADGAQMFTLTGVVSLTDEQHGIRSLFSGWPFANLRWGKPKRIDVPFLSTKERLHLQKHLPCRRDSGRRLVRKLGYIVDEDKRTSAAKMKQYADFHRYFPYFVKAIP